MSSFNKILCPVDLSENSMAAIELATTIARERDSRIVFMFVAPQWLPEEAMFGSDYIRGVTEDEKKVFDDLRPTHSSVGYEHVFVHGNAGPEIVSQSRKCDMVVMSTHGYGGVMRFLMGSVAQYTMRNAKCPVVMVRVPDIEKGKIEPSAKEHRFVTEHMHQMTPIHENDDINAVLALLNKANETAAPVINISGECIGILTQTDIARYRSLQKRYENKDESVIEEMFEVDKYGCRRAGNCNFDQVGRHMTSPVVTISNVETTAQAVEMFVTDQTIHHLVVVDEAGHPLGIVESADPELRSNREVTAKPTSE